MQWYSVVIQNPANGTTVVNTTTSDTSYQASLSYSTGYVWTVQACNYDGCSDPPAPLYFQTPTPVVETQTDYLALGGHMIAQTALAGGVSTVTYLHADLLGSPRLATNSSQGVLWHEHFDPYGQKMTVAAEKIGYTGHAYDAESGLTYMQARFYDPEVGRFLSSDPVAFKDTSPFTFNRYAYGNDDPYRNTDPTGMSCEINGTGDCGGVTLGQLKEGDKVAGDNGASFTVGKTDSDGNVSISASYSPSSASDGNSGGSSTYSPGSPGAHDYTVQNSVCCMTDSQARDTLLRFAVPGKALSKIEDGGIYLVTIPFSYFPGGLVRSTITNDGLTVINTTTPVHFFYNGQIERTLTPGSTPGSWNITTHGTGNNVLPGFGTINQYSGPAIFNALDLQMQFYVDVRYGGGN